MENTNANFSYKREITFLIDKQTNIYYHKIDLFHDHEDLIIENNINEFNVCRLVYDPNSDDTGFCGIPGISASMNVLFDALPFELKNTHLDAIERWIKRYDEIVAYANEHKDEYTKEYDPTKALNRIAIAYQKLSEEKKMSLAAAQTLFEKWANDFPILKLLNKTEIVDEMVKYNLSHKSSEEFKEEYLLGLKEKAKAIKGEQETEDILKLLSTDLEERDNGKGGKTITAKYHVDIAGFISQTENAIVLSGEVASAYWTFSCQVIYGILLKIADRACELNDSVLIELLQRLKLVEPTEKEAKVGTRE